MGQIVYCLSDRASRTMLASLLLLWAASIFAQPKAPREDLTIDPTTVMQPWTGNLDQMVERRIVRVQVVPSKTFLFQRQGYATRGHVRRLPVGREGAAERARARQEAQA